MQRVCSVCHVWADVALNVEQFVEGLNYQVGEANRFDVVAVAMSAITAMVNAQCIGPAQVKKFDRYAVKLIDNILIKSGASESTQMSLAGVDVPVCTQVRGTRT